jgi:hypothetical protein
MTRKEEARQQWEQLDRVWDEERNDLFLEFGGREEAIHNPVFLWFAYKQNHADVELRKALNLYYILYGACDSYLIHPSDYFENRDAA